MPKEPCNGPPFTAIDHVGLAMPRGQEDAARQFYAGILGFEELPKPPELGSRGGVWFGSGNVQLHLGVDNDFKPARKAHPALRCSDYRGVIERLKAHGVDTIADDSAIDGSAHCYVHDPFGNRIELIDRSRR
ncbi:MAG: VOC family protein [Candidatus Eremiobacteraeota bacterium]|nr:VOC family protein [Candidatus Eremiobacteraeota bacterium]